MEQVFKTGKLIIKVKFCGDSGPFSGNPEMDVPTPTHLVNILFKFASNLSLNYVSALILNQWV